MLTLAPSLHPVKRLMLMTVQEEIQGTVGFRYHDEPHPRWASRASRRQQTDARLAADHVTSDSVHLLQPLHRRTDVGRIASLPLGRTSSPRRRTRSRLADSRPPTLMRLVQPSPLRSPCTAPRCAGQSSMLLAYDSGGRSRFFPRRHPRLDEPEEALKHGRGGAPAGARSDLAGRSAWRERCSGRAPCSQRAGCRVVLGLYRARARSG